MARSDTRGGARPSSDGLEAVNRLGESKLALVRAYSQVNELQQEASVGEGLDDADLATLDAVVTEALREIRSLRGVEGPADHRR